MRRAVKKVKWAAKRAGLTRAQVAHARVYLERQMLAQISMPRPKPSGRILCYHSVGQPVMGVNDVTPFQFRRQIELALDEGYRFVRPSMIAAGKAGLKDLAITFDDGLVSVKKYAAPLLEEFGIPWSVFVVSKWAEQVEPWTRGFALSWGELEDFAAQGVDIGNHSVSHPDFNQLAPEEMIEELEGSGDMFERRLGVKPKAFAIPYGQSMNWPAHAHRLAQKAGYDVIYAQAEETRPSGTIARTFVTRFDTDRIFKALLNGAYDRWEEWY